MKKKETNQLPLKTIYAIVVKASIRKRKKGGKDAAFNSMRAAAMLSSKWL